MYEYTFIAPNKPLSENESRSMHWANRYRRLKKWKEVSELAIKTLPSKTKKELKDKKLEVLVHLPFQRNARRDPHNYVGTNVKTIIDTFVTSGLLKDDTTQYIKVLEPVLYVNKEEIVIVKINIIEEGEND